MTHLTGRFYLSCPIEGCEWASRSYSEIGKLQIDPLLEHLRSYHGKPIVHAQTTDGGPGPSA